MPTISLDNHTIRTMAFFKDKTGVSPINCIGINETIIFVVESGSARKAVGQNGEKVKALSSALKKDIKIVERGQTMDETIEKFIYPIPFNSSKVVRGTLAILLKNPTDRKKLNGNGKKTLRQLKEIVKMYHQNVRNVQLI